MKRILTIIVLSTTVCLGAKAQDIITKKGGEEIKVKVQEVGQTEIKYKLYDNQNGPLYSVNKSDLFMIKYENGTKEVISQNNQISSTDDMYSKGQEDAKRYYTKHKGAGAGTFATSFLAGPIIGLIPAIACSSSSPNYDNLGFPNADLMKNTEYTRGYTESAKKKKSGKVWKNFGIGSGLALIAVILAGSGG